MTYLIPLYPYTLYPIPLFVYIYSSTTYVIQGAAAGDALGTSVAGAGDVNNDSFDDVIVGAPGAQAYTGAAYVIYICI
jgi:hypothetical protein